MRRIIRGLGLFILIGLTGGLLTVCKPEKPQAVGLAGLLPDSAAGWESVGEDQVYDPETIFDYINGAGEVYRAYDFVTLLARQYSRDGQPDILVDVFDMGASGNAYGVFTHDLEGEDVGIGQDSTYKGGLLTFWKDHIYATVFSERETSETEEAVLEIGQKIAGAIPNTGPLPGVISLLPVENQVEKSLRYLFNPIILNYYFYVADENILFLDSDTPAALAGYMAEEVKYHLLLVQYPLPEKARDAYQSFVSVYMPDAQEEGTIQTENEKWTVARVRDNLLLIVFDAPSQAYALHIVEKVFSDQP